MSEALSLIALAISIITLGIALYLYRKCVGDFRDRFKILSNALSSKAVRAYVKVSEAREKRKLSKRYMILKILGKPSDFKGIQRVVEEGISKLFGNSSVSLIQPRILYYNPTTAKAVLRFKASYKWRLIASLGLSEGLSSSLILIPVKTTGTLRKARKYADSLN